MTLLPLLLAAGATAAPPECGQLAIALSEPAKYRPQLAWASPACRDAIRAGQWPGLATELGRVAHDPGLAWDATATLCGIPVPDAELEIVAMFSNTSAGANVSHGCLRYLYESDAPIAHRYLDEAILADDGRIVGELFALPVAKRDAFAATISDWYRRDPVHASYAVAGLCDKRPASDHPVCAEVASANAALAEDRRIEAKSLDERIERGLAAKDAADRAAAAERLQDRILRRVVVVGVSLLAAYVVCRIQLERGTLRERWRGAVAAAGVAHASVYAAFVAAVIGANLVRIVFLGILREVRGAEDAIALFFGTGFVGIVALAATLAVIPVAGLIAWAHPRAYLVLLGVTTLAYAASLAL